MFEEFLWQGRDMIRRFEGEEPLSAVERDALPAEKRVTMTEEQAWLKGLEAKIQEHFGDEAYARYRIFWDLYKEEGERGDDQFTRVLRVHRRIVDYLAELQHRLERTNNSPSAKGLAETPATQLAAWSGGTGTAADSGWGSAAADPDQPTRAAGTREYDVALSFAGEDRAHAEALAGLLRDAGFRVFYDHYEQADLWGKNLYTHLSDVYASRARFCIIFLSKYYASKLWTRHEHQAAQDRAFSESREYILPVKIDDTPIAGVLSTTGYLDLRDTPIAQICDLLVAKLRSADS